MRHGLTMVLAIVALGASLYAVGTSRLGAEPRPNEIGVSADDAARLVHEAVERERRGVERELRALRGELAALETRLGSRRDVDAPAPTQARAEAPGDAPADGSATDAADSSEGVRARLAELQARVLRGESTADELESFLKLARSDGLAGTLVVEAEAAVEAAPRDVAARMALADAYLTKLLTVPGGPEQGVWGMRAESQWQEVLAQNETHWEARRRLASSWAMWPEFLGKTNPAIAQLERLVEVQEARSPETRHAGVYLDLARLHDRKGEASRAREILERGLGRHPGDAALANALDAREE